MPEKHKCNPDRLTAGWAVMFLNSGFRVFAPITRMACIACPSYTPSWAPLCNGESMPFHLCRVPDLSADSTRDNQINLTPLSGAEGIGVNVKVECSFSGTAMVNTGEINNSMMIFLLRISYIPFQYTNICRAIGCTITVCWLTACACFSE
jgi:hypothetical protein